MNYLNVICGIFINLEKAFDTVEYTSQTYTLCDKRFS